MEQFEIFVGANGKKYYVYDSGYWPEIEKTICKHTKDRFGSFICITVWIVRGVMENGELFDYLYVEKTKGAEKKLAAVKM